MKLGASFRTFLALLAASLGISAAEPSMSGRTGNAPKPILEDVASWQQQSGTWEVSGGSAKGTANETVGELAAVRGARMPDRWLSFKVALTGDAVKAGVLFAGIRDSRGEILRFSVEQASASLTNGRGKMIAALGEMQPAVELLVKFSPEKVTVHQAGAQLAEIPVTYAEEQATISWFVERGTAQFSDVLLGNVPAAGSLAATPPVPVKGGRPQVGKKVESLSLDLPAAKAMTLKGDWNEYFGVHFETEVGPWKMVRQFDGPEFGYPPKGRHSGDIKTYPGPFAGQPVELSLADYRDWKRKDARGLDEDLKSLIEQDRAGLYIAPWVSTFTTEQQDAVWALMKAVYGANVGAEGRVFFQWGDDINFRKLGTVTSTRVLSSSPRGGASPARGANQAADAVAYAENYFAPAVEATRRASAEIYRDERHIPILIGSCARASQGENRQWYSKVLGHELAGTSAPSLKGKKVIELTDYLTVNYPFFGVHDALALQELWEQYGAKVKGLWVTEEFGSTSRSTSVFLERLCLFLEWAATNQLDAQQTRLFWNLPARGDEKGNDLPRRLGTVFGGGPLQVARVEAGTSRIYRISAGDGKVLFVHLPPAEKRGKRTSYEVTLTPPAGMEDRVWEATYISSKDRQNTLSPGVAVPIDKKDGKLVPAIDGTTQEAWALLMVAK